MDIDLLRDLYEIYSPSLKEKRIRKYIRRYIETIPDIVKKEVDGNMYITKGVSDAYPCIVAHLDQVQDPYPKDYKTVVFGDTIMGWSDSTHSQCGLGADDKNGIYIALRALQFFDAVKVAFFTGEERGCIGSSKAEMSFFLDCRFVIEPDRRGSSDLITTMCGVEVCSQEFLGDIPYNEFGYIPTQGSLTDALTLCENGLGLACINLSCGYHHPHTEQEITVLSELENCERLVFAIAMRCQDIYYHEPPKVYDYATVYGGEKKDYTHYGYNTYAYDDIWEDSDWDRYLAEERKLQEEYAY